MGNENSVPLNTRDGDYSDDDDDGPRPPMTYEQLRCAQKSDLDPPKRAMTPFNCFVKEKAAESGKRRCQAGDMTDCMDDLSSDWKEMTDEEKAPYVAAASEDRNRYAAEKAKYENDKSQIIKRPVNGYIAFMRDFRQQQKGNYKDAKELVRQGAKAWKRLNKEQKQPFQQKSLEDSDRYAQERLQWCNKVVKPRWNDTRFSTDPTKPDKPSEMDLSDQAELKEWLRSTKSTQTSPNSAPSESSSE